MRWFFWLFFKALFLIIGSWPLLSCSPGAVVILSSVEPALGPDFFFNRRGQDPDRDEILQQSKDFYAGEPECASDPSCRRACSLLFSFSFDKKDCQSLSIPQVRRWQRLYDQLEEGDLASLRAVSPFDLKLFLNLSPEPMGRLAKGLGFVSAKRFLRWIADDWQTAQALYEEDWDFFILDILLNETHFSPISSLREELADGLVFAERAWIKQNDFALFWMEGRLAGLQCPLNNEGPSCLLAQYCRLSSAFESNVSDEILHFESLRQAVGQTSLEQATWGGICF